MVEPLCNKNIRINETKLCHYHCISEVKKNKCLTQRSHAALTFFCRGLHDWANRIWISGSVRLWENSLRLRFWPNPEHCVTVTDQPNAGIWHSAWTKLRYNNQLRSQVEPGLIFSTCTLIHYTIKWGEITKSKICYVKFNQNGPNLDPLQENVHATLVRT